MEKITEAMVLALLRKGLVYELEDCEMDYDMEIPLTMLGLEDDEVPVIEMAMQMNIKHMRLEIKEG